MSRGHVHRPPVPRVSGRFATSTRTQAEPQPLDTPWILSRLAGENHTTVFEEPTRRFVPSHDSRSARRSRSMASWMTCRRISLLWVSDPSQGGSEALSTSIFNSYQHEPAARHSLSTIPHALHPPSLASTCCSEAIERPPKKCFFGSVYHQPLRHACSIDAVAPALVKSTPPPFREIFLDEHERKRMNAD